MIIQLVKFALLLVGLAAIAAPAQPVIYKNTDAQGNITFSDSQDSGHGLGEKVELKPLTPIQMHIPAPLSNSSVNSSINSSIKKTRPGYRSLAILSPADGTRFQGNDLITVVIESQPGLHPGDTLVLLVNNIEQHRSRTDRVFQLADLPRGEHTLEARIIKASGRLMKSSSRHTVYVFRPIIRSNRPGQNSPRPMPMPQN